MATSLAAALAALGPTAQVQVLSGPAPGRTPAREVLLGRGAGGLLVLVLLRRFA